MKIPLAALILLAAASAARAKDVFYPHPSGKKSITAHHEGESVVPAALTVRGSAGVYFLTGEELARERWTLMVSGVMKQFAPDSRLGFPYGTEALQWQMECVPGLLHKPAADREFASKLEALKARHRRLQARVSSLRAEAALRDGARRHDWLLGRADELLNESSSAIAWGGGALVRAALLSTAEPVGAYWEAHGKFMEAERLMGNLEGLLVR
jgi:hypothetical protein